jgi:hypothetical protein
MHPGRHAIHAPPVDTLERQMCLFPAFAGQGFRIPPQLGIKAISCLKVVSTRLLCSTLKGSRSAATRNAMFVVARQTLQGGMD